MKRIIATAVLLMLACQGCAQFKTTQTDTSITTNLTDQTVTSRTITTRASATTFAAGEQALSNWKAAQTDKSQAASVGAVQQQSDATALIEAATRGAVQGARMSVVPIP